MNMSSQEQKNKTYCAGVPVRSFLHATSISRNRTALSTQFLFTGPKTVPTMPRCPIIAVTRYGQIARQAHLYRGILPLVYSEPAVGDWLKDVDTRVQFGIQVGKKNGFIKSGDSVVIVTGWKQGSGFTNTMRIITVE